LGMADRAAFFAGDWAEALDAKFDLILSNPPYIPAEDVAQLMPEVAQYEPMRALDGGAEGLDAYRRIIAALPRLLTEHGSAVLEFGVSQAQYIQEIAREAGFSCITRRDFGGHERAAILTQCK